MAYTMSLIIFLSEWTVGYKSTLSKIV